VTHEWTWTCLPISNSARFNNSTGVPPQCISGVLMLILSVVFFLRVCQLPLGRLWFPLGYVIALRPSLAFFSSPNSLFPTTTGFLPSPGVPPRLFERHSRFFFNSKWFGSLFRFFHSRALPLRASADPRCFFIANRAGILLCLKSLGLL